MGSRAPSGARITPDDPHALPSMRGPLTRPPVRFTYDPDPIEVFCPACTTEYDRGWRHERS